MKRPESPEIDLRALVSISDAASSAQGGCEAATRENWEALQAWKDALLRRHELQLRLHRLKTQSAGETPPAELAEIDVAHLDASLADRLPQSPPRLAERMGAWQMTDDLDTEQLSQARGVSRVGCAVPEFSYHGRAKRFLARFLARIGLFLARTTTAYQRIVNTAVLDFVTESAAKINEQGSKIDQLAERILRLAEDIDKSRSERSSQIHQALLELDSGLHGLRSDVHGLRSDVQQSRHRLDGVEHHAAQSRLRSLEQEHRLADVECEQAWRRLAELDRRKELGDISRRLRALEETRA